MYKPHKLTSFDSIISEEEFSFPIVIESSPLANKPNLSWKDKKSLQNSNDDTNSGGGAGGGLSRSDSKDNNLGMFGKIGKYKIHDN